MRRGKTLWSQRAHGRRRGCPRTSRAYFELIERLPARGRDQRLRVVDLPLRQDAPAADHLDRQHADHQPLHARCPRDHRGRTRPSSSSPRRSSRASCPSATTTSSPRSSARRSRKERHRAASRRSCAPRSSRRSAASGDHLLVYQTGEGNEALRRRAREDRPRVPHLRHAPRHHGGAGRGQPALPARSARTASSTTCASCAAVIAGGGFTLMGEAVYLHKPMLAVPLEASSSRSSTRATSSARATAARRHARRRETVLDFLAAVPACEAKLASYTQDGNAEDRARHRRVARQGGGGGDLKRMPFVPRIEPPACGGRRRRCTSRCIARVSRCGARRRRRMLDAAESSRGAGAEALRRTTWARWTARARSRLRRRTWWTSRSRPQRLRGFGAMTTQRSRSPDARCRSSSGQRRTASAAAARRRPSERRASDRCAARRAAYRRIRGSRRPIITLVRKGDLALLAHGARFPAPFYSTLAGFVEPGESLEETLVREVKEEVGVDVGDIRYFGSQSWPFPHSLMLGFFATWKSGEIVRDPSEIVDAKWFRERPADDPGCCSASRESSSTCGSRTFGGGPSADSSRRGRDRFDPSAERSDPARARLFIPRGLWQN